MSLKTYSPIFKSNIFKSVYLFYVPLTFCCYVPVSAGPVFFLFCFWFAGILVIVGVFPTEAHYA